MAGILKEDRIVVEDEKEANRLYNKGYFGQPQSGNYLELSFYEGIYLLEADRLEIVGENGKSIKKEDVLERVPRRKFMREYPVYKDMRSRGYVLKEASDPASFRVFPRGGGPGQTPTKYWICTAREKENFYLKEILEANRKISNLGKAMLTALVDEEGDVTYYIFSTIDLKGRVEKYDGESVKGIIYGDKCIIKEGFKDLYENNFYGSREDGNLNLSFYEILYLRERGILEIEKTDNDATLSWEELESEHTKKEGFELMNKVYKDLRERGLIPKTGFKYGTEFRAYAGDPDEIHAEYIVQPVEKEHKSRWYEVSRAVRVAHSVRKDFIFGIPEDGKVSYLKIKRETP
ncbi:MAG: tRNA-intron lyase [Candidatus Aenigmatarchaeota archaeon]